MNIYVNIIVCVNVSSRTAEQVCVGPNVIHFNSSGYVGAINPSTGQFCFNLTARECSQTSDSRGDLTEMCGFFTVTP